MYPIISGASRRLVNASYKDWSNNADLCARALLKAREEFDLDCIVTLIDLSVECDAWGQELIFPENEPHIRITASVLCRISRIM